MASITDAMELGRRRAMTSIEEYKAMSAAESVRKRAATECPQFAPRAPAPEPPAAGGPAVEVVDGCPKCGAKWGVNGRDADRHFATCCGAYLCASCAPAASIDPACPVCGAPPPATREENAVRLRSLVDADHPAGTREMARLFDTGDGGRLPSHTEAFRLHRCAAELGNVPAMVEVGIAYEAGRGVGVDKRKACRAYGLAADRGDVIGMCRLARCYTLGPGDGVDDVDYAAAAKLYQRAADLGFVNAVACLEDLRAKGRIPGDPTAKKAPPAPPPPGTTPGEPPRTTF